MNRVEGPILITLLIIACLLPPITFYIYSDVQRISAEKAAELIRAKPGGTLLLDVRNRREFDRVHIYPSFNIPSDELFKRKLKNDELTLMRGKKVLVLCNSGLDSIRVTKILRDNHINAININGGLSAWIANVRKSPPQVRPFILHAEKDELFPYRKAPLYEQWLAVLTGYGIKPLYTIISLVLIIILWRKTEIELTTLKYSMIFFFLGENFCAANYLFFKHESWLFEYFHSLGMVICFGFATYVLIQGLDKYIFHYSDQMKKCAFISLCAKCIKYEPTPCILKRIFIFIILAAALLSFMPLFAELKMISYNTEIWRTHYNYSHPVVYQLYEIRYCPIIAAIAFASAALILMTKKRDPFPLVKMVFAAACGAAGFSFFRFILFHGFQDHLVWMEFWEEITEFIFITGTSFVLWQFRARLFKG